MKRIIFSVTNDLTYDRRMHRICSTLRDAGYTVTLVGRVLPKSEELIKRTFQQKRISCIFQTGPFFYAEFNIRLFLWLLVQKRAILCACDLDTVTAVLLAGKLRRTSLVFDGHEHFTEVPEVERRRFVKSVWHRIGKWAIPRMQIRYTVGEALAEVLAQAYHAPFSVIRNTPPLSHGAIVPAEKRIPEIVYIGALNEGRGLEVAIAAMRDLPEFTLKLIGEGDLSQELRGLIQTHHVTERVVFRGMLRPDQLHEEIAHAFAAINLLESRSLSYYYSLANKFFDYMHAGVPSINMAFPEYQSILEKYPVGICIDALTPEAVVAAVLQLRPLEVRKAMTDNAHEARKMYCWEKERTELLRLYGSLGQ